MVNLDWGVCLWLPEWGNSFVDEENLVEFSSLFPYSKVFHFLKKEDEWVVCQYMDKIFKAKMEIFRPTSEPKFKFLQIVESVSGIHQGIICDISWHFKLETHIYFISQEGKKMKRRFFAHELLPK